jgi:hypothetical protein
LELRYKHVESALADALGIQPGDIGAFRARLRNLRNLGLPKLPKPGSGAHITYTRCHALEMLIAVELEQLGQAPRWAGMLAEPIARVSPFRGTDANDDQYIILSKTDETAFRVVHGREAFTHMLSISSAPIVFSVINLSECKRKLDASLDRAVQEA